MISQTTLYLWLCTCGVTYRFSESESIWGMQDPLSLSRGRPEPPSHNLGFPGCLSSSHTAKRGRVLSSLEKEGHPPGLSKEKATARHTLPSGNRRNPPPPRNLEQGGSPLQASVCRAVALRLGSRSVTGRVFSWGPQKHTVLSRAQKDPVRPGRRPPVRPGTAGLSPVPFSAEPQAAGGRGHRGLENPPTA